MATRHQSVELKLPKRVRFGNTNRLAVFKDHDVRTRYSTENAAGTDHRKQASTNRTFSTKLDFGHCLCNFFGSGSVPFINCLYGRLQRIGQVILNDRHNLISGCCHHRHPSWLGIRSGSWQKIDLKQILSNFLGDFASFHQQDRCTVGKFARSNHCIHACFCVIDHDCPVFVHDKITLDATCVDQRNVSIGK